MTTAAAEQALIADESRCGTLLCQVPESQWFERKGPRVAARDLANTLVAFANADGGIVVVGLSKDRSEGVERSCVVGIYHSGPRLLSSWRQAAIDFTVPVVPISTELLACVNQSGQRDHLLVFRIRKSNVVHATVADEVFLRVGDETRKLRFDQRRELLHDKGQSIYEATPIPDASQADLDPGAMTSWASALGSGNGERLLTARGLVDRAGQITVAAVLLFGITPQAWFPQARVRILRYRGNARGVGRGQQLETDRQVDGSLLGQIEEARRSIKSLMPSREAFGHRGRFETVPIIPTEVWSEALVNAVVHRSYSMSGDHIRFEIFDNRIEVHSPGRFPGLANGADPREVMRYARNPNIARVCADMRFGQELGEGIRRMFDRMRREGLVDPVFEQRSSSVHVTLLARTTVKGVEEALPQTARQVLQLLRVATRLSTGEIMAATFHSRPTVLRHIKTLQTAGLVKWVGSSRQDPQAYWVLTEHEPQTPVL